MDSQQLSRRLAELAVSDSGFVFDPKTGASYTLNETGARLFQLFKDGRSREEAAVAIAAEFEADPGLIERDVFDFLCQLSALGLLKPGHRG